MKRQIKWLLIFGMCVVLLVPNAFAVQEARPLPVDQRLRVITYNPLDVIKFTGHYEYQSSIVFEDGEVISTISMGTTTAWQIVPSGSRMFLKPIEENATTNMTVITNRRVYNFELHAREVDPEMGINDDQLIFVMTFRYPDSTSTTTGGVMFFGGNEIEPDLTEPEKYNFNYTISGSEEISPLRIFDDGEFTYVQFSKRTADIPAFFRVAADGSESLVNYRVQGSYIVLERVVSQLTLRSGDEITCVYNETRPMRKVKKKK
jgi:type IV secretion system protein VirB9